MKQLTARLVLGIALLALAACTAQRHLNAGDEAAAVGDMQGALYHYQRAMSHDESLSESKSFSSKLAIAEARVAYDQAVKLRRQGNYEQAIEKLKAAATHDPSYQAPIDLLIRVQSEAANVRYVNAVRSADAGDLKQARINLDVALSYKPDHAEAAFAKASLAVDQLPKQTPGLDVYQRGVGLSAEHRWPEAMQAYNQAIGLSPGLLPARASLHEAGRQHTRALRLTEQADGLLTEKQVGPAIDTYEQSLAVWPFNENAINGLAQANRLQGMADRQLAESEAEKAKGRWEQAIAAADKGLSIDRSHAGLIAHRREIGEQAAADYARVGVEQLEQGKLDEAEASFARSVELDRSLRQAANGLQQTRAQRGEALSLADKGEAHLKTRQMTGAIELLSRSLALWPFNGDASALLEEAKTQQAEADKRYALAKASVEEGSWDEAMSKVEAGLAMDRSHSGLIALQQAVPKRAATHFAQQGDAELAADRYDQAQVFYVTALSYVDDDDKALVGMADVYQERGEALEKKGLIGGALLHYAVGRAYQPEHAVSESLERATYAVRSRVGMGLGLSVTQARRGAIRNDDLAKALTDQLRPYRLDGLGVGGRNEPYTLKLSIDQAVIDTRRVRSANYTHPYNVTELRHNDAYDDLVACIQREDAAYHKVEAEYDHWMHKLEDARRHYKSIGKPTAPGKPQGGKRGAGEDAAQQQRYEHELAAYQKQLKAYRRAKAAADEIRRKCERLKDLMSRHDRALIDYKHKLSRTPHKVEVVCEHQWPYAVETHERYGKFVITSTLIDNATGRAVERTTHQAQFAVQDDAVLQPNPEIGLACDTLEFPSDASISSQLKDELVQAAAPWAVNLAVQHALGLKNKKIDQLRKAGDHEGALEAEVDSAVLLNIVDSDASSELLNTLAEQHVP